MLVTLFYRGDQFPTSSGNASFTPDAMAARGVARIELRRFRRNAHVYSTRRNTTIGAGPDIRCERTFGQYSLFR